MMTIEEALVVLNQQRHRGSDRWHVVGGLRYTRVRPFDDSSSAAWLTDFEAIAIAEKYAPHHDRLTEAVRMVAEGLSK